MPEFYVRPATPEEIINGLNQEHLLSKPGFLPHMCRIGVLDGQVISTMITGRSVLLFGKRQLRVAVLGNLALLPNYRDTDYATLMIQDTLTYLREQGAHLALVRDLVGDYDRFGFSPVWPEYTLSFDAQQAALLNKPHTLYAPEDEHIPQIAALYDKHWGSRITFRRNPELWIWRMTEDIARQTTVTIDPDGKVSGYISGYDLLSDEVEIVVDNMDAAMTIMAEIARKMRKSTGQEIVRWPVPPDDALVSFARELLDVMMSAAFHQRTGWMSRIIDTNALSKTILPELFAQAQSTLGTFDPDSLNLKANPANMEISLSGPYPIMIQLSYRDFSQMLFGSLTPYAYSLRDKMRPGALELLQALFPPRVAAVGHWDWV